MARPQRPDASMTLLTEAMERPLDPSYAAAAAARRAAGLPASTGTRTLLLLVAAVGVGFLLAVAAVALGPGDTTTGQAKEHLIEQIDDRSTAQDALVERISALEGRVSAARASLAGVTELQAIHAEMIDLEARTGAAAVTGPGLVVELDDAVSAASGSGSPRDDTAVDDGRVTASDIQMVVNGLWLAQAEAVAVNDQRLTARSAISFAGAAVLVDYRPLSPPYTIFAIGDPARLPTRFALSPAGGYLKALAENYQIRSTTSSVASLTLPRSASLIRPATTATPTPTPTSPAPAVGPTEATP